MQYINLGSTGLRVSRICMGMMAFGAGGERPWVRGEDDAEPIVRAAVEGGVSYFDTSNSYSHGASEVAAGRLLRRFLTRDEMVVATKVYGEMTPGENGRGLSRKHILSAIDASLERLGMDYIDLYQIHHWDDAVPIEETLDALNDVVRAGKARYIGASNLAGWQLMKAQLAAKQLGLTSFISVQNHYNLLYREEEREMIPCCVDSGIGYVPWSPLARGVLAGNRTRDGNMMTTRASSDAASLKYYGLEADFDVVDHAAEIAIERGISIAQVSLAWLLHKPAVTAPIVGSTRLEHINEALGATDIDLSADEMKRLEEAYVPHRRF